MVDSGDWVTPRLNGETWFEKPILYYWGAAAAISVFGPSERSARMPSAIALFLAGSALAVLAGRTYGLTSALALAFMLPSMLATIGFARGASTDAVFSAMLTLAFVAGARVAEIIAAERIGFAGVGRSRERLGWLGAWGAALGFAVLAKGPAALLLAGGSIALWALVMRRWNWALTFAHPMAVAAFALVALPWYVLCALRNPDFVRVFLVEHNVQRFLTPVFAHEQPWWYFGAVLTVGLVPWTTILVPTLRDTWSEISNRRAPVTVLAICWVLVPFLFFTASRSKLPGYILPIFPPLVMLMARSLTSRLEAPDRGRLLLASTGGLLLVVAGLISALTLQLVPARLATPIATLGLASTWPLAIGAAGLGIVLLAIRRHSWLALGLTSTVMAILAIGVNGRIVPAIDPHLSSRAAAEAARHAAGNGSIFEFGLQRNTKFGLDYYLQRHVTEWSPEAGEGVVVVRATTLKTFAASGYLIDVVERVSADAVITRVRRADTIRLLSPTD
jgi:4-amino-4-deoxy-L-arabinose transferase-like glycosyltransferase